MIFTTQSGQSFDTDKDLSAPERHILQKLFAWEALSTSLEQFQDKKREALEKGWNESGPVQAGAPMKAIIRDLERKVRDRLA
ncbi:hypothetical protein [Desulfatiglans anilini]|uniref:hypothetical protein n=1 Tax=Desulfatiglans anilini TaxID=90728 RepID=UPI0003F91511|nr:hypothetical protein [Desulfatiglans anilini]